MKRRTTIGVAIDVEEAPSVVLRHAVAWGRHLDALLHVVTVSDDPGDDVGLAELTNQLPQELRGKVTRLPVPKDSDEGTPISQALAGLDVDVLLVGTHARKGIDRLLFGSVSMPIVRFSPHPVLVCPLHAEPAGGPLVVACPVDPDELQWSAVRWVVSHIPASIQVLAAYPHETATQQMAGVNVDEEVRQALEEGLADLDAASRITLHGLPGLTGSPAALLAEAAKRLDVDLVAVASHQRHGAARIWHGSVAEHLVRESDCAVLVVPIPDEGA